jgi:hypothetical protein
LKQQWRLIGRRASSNAKSTVGDKTVPAVGDFSVSFSHFVGYPPAISHDSDANHAVELFLRGTATRGRSPAAGGEIRASPNCGYDPRTPTRGFGFGPETISFQRVAGVPQQRVHQRRRFFDAEPRRLAKVLATVGASPKPFGPDHKAPGMPLPPELPSCLRPSFGCRGNDALTNRPDH